MTITITTEEAERQAKYTHNFWGLDVPATMIRALAAERDALRAENALLRDVLRLYADDNYNGYNGNGAHARAALGEKE
jgi:hypothetical protein